MNYTIRPCQALKELAACVALQKRIWGYSERELYPLRLLVTLTKIGGHVLGAFTPGNRMIGFVASMPAWRGRRRYFHSLSLGVLPGRQNQGLGRALKLRQRETALREGIHLIEWTFDPLQAKNAFFNIVRLGAVVRRYLCDHYGPVESRLQGGLPSDRLVAEWRLKSERVRRVLTGKAPWNEKSRPAAEVEIPPSLSSLLRADPERARAEQSRVREKLQNYFSRGFAITGFIREGNSARYILSRHYDR